MQHTPATDFDRIAEIVETWDRIETGKPDLLALSLAAHSCNKLEQSRQSVVAACKIVYTDKTAISAAKSFMPLEGKKLETALMQPWNFGSVRNLGRVQRAAIGMGWSDAKDLDPAQIQGLETLREASRIQAADLIQFRSSIVQGLQQLTTRGIAINDFSDLITFGSRLNGATNQTWNELFQNADTRRDVPEDISPAGINVAIGKAKQDYRKTLSELMPNLSQVPTNDVSAKRLQKTIETAGKLGLHDIGRQLTEWGADILDSAATPGAARSHTLNHQLIGTGAPRSQTSTPKPPTVRPDHSR